MLHIEHDTLILSGDHKVAFRWPIAESVVFENILILRFEQGGQRPLNENVCGVDLQGKILWQIKPRMYPMSECPYVNINRKGDFVEAYGWDGRVLTLDPKSGDILAENWVDIGVSRAVSERLIKNYF